MGIAGQKGRKFDLKAEAVQGKDSKLTTLGDEAGFACA